MKHIAAIDGLRALAVSGVLVAHYIPEGAHIHVLPWGSLGVQLFFVLSGYLITRILIESADLEGPGRHRKILKSFYARRFLRISPPYYLLLGLLVILGLQRDPAAMAASFFYVINFLEAANPQGSYAHLGHLWTLCIEEQFYLFWPWLALLLPRRFLPSVTLGLVGFALISRFLLLSAGWDYLSVRNMPTSQLDALAGGSLLAQFHTGVIPRWADGWQRRGRALLWSALTVYLCIELIPVLGALKPTLGIFASAVFFIGVVDHTARGTLHPSLRWLESKPCVFVGKISYGIYLYHFISLIVLYKIISLMNAASAFANPWLFVPAWTACTLMLATLSSQFFERPILRLKRYFPY